jgi:AcrR family transcriptional regulator
MLDSMQASRSPVRADARANHARLLAAAREVLAERGFAVDVSEIARRAGVGAGTLYRNFPNKDALLLAIVEELVTKTIHELTEVSSGVEDARECIARVMQVGFERLEEYGQLVVAIVAGTQPPAFQHLADQRVLGDFLASLIRRGIQQGHFRPDLDVEYAVAVWFALVAPSALNRLMTRRSVEEIAGLTTDFFLAGLTARSPEPGAA